MSDKRKMSGFSLIEVVIGLMVLAVVLAGLSVLMHQGFNQLSFSRETQAAYALAELYMDEVLSTGRWDELTQRTNAPGGSVWPVSLASIGAEESSRSGFDDIDDYHNAVYQAPHQSRNGTSLGDRYAGYRVAVTVRFANDYGEPLASGETHLKHILIEVSWGTTQQISLTTLVSNT